MEIGIPNYHVSTITLSVKKIAWRTCMTLLSAFPDLYMNIHIFVAFSLAQNCLSVIGFTFELILYQI